MLSVTRASASTWERAVEGDFVTVSVSIPTRHISTIKKVARNGTAIRNEAWLNDVSFIALQFSLLNFPPDHSDLPPFLLVSW